LAILDAGARGIPSTRGPQQRRSAGSLTPLSTAGKTLDCA